MSMRDLVEAGAPELPEGWFYRIRSDRFGWPEVEIRQPRKRFGSRTVSYALVRTEQHDDGMSAVVAACVKAYIRMEEDDEHFRKQREALAFSGDHDPKGRR
ncbi:hypothetical protein PV332_10535 [Streptomyces scabiei]|uniref:hypothetical protein n=1 Tax=Streptomyces scabiei TaxID=1930 RepID=UPI0029BCF9F4|nr:hypothetical protein [Streptomyces scabiei]MDX2575917.1 hypothetical protein [Streptomyces scabiei]MDX2885610.1 hypothetical protein [Streptomyces scabiei]MDX2993437.1 hypothetical protein [Streptomyces scabiei]MDX3028449.1 hypothetical protein [Streptomyces scabiei]MDX3047217.1 hypothetical protein [Streptomyces scabiei]